MSLPLKAAERLVYRKLRFWIHNLHVTSELLTDLHNGRLLNDNEFDAMKQMLAEAQQSGRTVELHEKLLLYVLQMSNHDVDRFLIAVEKYQPDVVKHVLGGLTTAQVITGFRGGQAPRRLSASSESVTLSPTLTPESSIGSVESFEAVSGAGADSSFGVTVGAGGDQMPPLSEYLLMHGVSEEEPPCQDPTIDSEGGEVSSGLVTLKIPPGALTAPIPVPPPGFRKFDYTTFCAEDGQEIRRGMAIYLYPHGLKFIKPVTVSIRDDNILFGSQAVLFASNTKEEELPQWEDVTDRSNILVDSDRREASFTVSHFSLAAIFYMSVMSAAALSAVVSILQTKKLYVALFWRRDGASDIRLLICSSFDQSELEKKPRAAEDYERATNPSDPVLLAYNDSYKYSLQVDGAKPKALDKNRLLKSQEIPTQKTVRLLSCCETVSVSLECSSEHGQVLLEALLQGHDSALSEQRSLPAVPSSTNPTAAAAPSPSLDTQAAMQGRMVVWCDEALRLNFEKLVRDMNPRDVLDNLVQKGVVSMDSEEYQNISGKDTRADANRQIIFCILSRGEWAFHELVGILRFLSPSLSKLLSDDFERLSTTQ